MSLSHHADLGHLSLQLGARDVLKVVLAAALPASRVCLHDEVLHVQGAPRDPHCIGHRPHRWAQLGGRVVATGLLGDGGGEEREGGWEGKEGGDKWRKEGLVVGDREQVLGYHLVM